MHSDLIKYCSQLINLSNEDIDLLCSSFKSLRLKRKEFLLKEGERCSFIAFLNSGIVRHFYIKDGNENICNIVLANNFFTNLKSFSENTPSSSNLQVLQDAEILIIYRDELTELYEKSNQIKSLGRLITEKVAKLAIDKAISLSSDKPEERIEKLLLNSPKLFQEVPQRYLASLIGITPESFSRIRSRIQKNKES